MGRSKTAAPDLWGFLGAERTDDGLRADITRDMYGAYEGAFGGYVAAFALSAARRVVPDRRPVALDARFLERLPAGTVHARARVAHEGRTMTTIDVDILDSNSRRCASAAASFVAPDRLHAVDDAAMVRPGASVTYAEASPFQLRRADVPVVTTLGPRVSLTSADLVATALVVPWEQPDTGPEASCVVADMAAGPAVAPEVESDWVPQVTPDLSLRFCAHDAGAEVTGVARLERVTAGVATVRLEVFSGIELLAVGCSSTLLLGLRTGERT